MSIQWYRGAARRVKPKRDNPSAPKDVKPKKPKKLGLPQFPKIRKPRVQLPFVKAINYTGFLPNLSGAGLDAVKSIADANHLKAGEVRWIKNTEGDCQTPLAKDSIYGKCDALSSWPSLESFMSKRNPRHDGIWGVSHVNCQCSVTVRLFDPKDPNKFADFKVYTNPAAASDTGRTAAAGYGWVAGSIPEEALAGLSPEKITDLNKMDSTDKKERDEAQKRNDVFEQPAPIIDRPRVVTPSPAEPESAPAAGPAAVEPAPERAPEPVTEAPASLDTAPELTPEEEEKRRKEEEEKGFLG